MAELFFHASMVIKLVLLSLASFSIISWTLILYKYLHLHAASEESKAIVEALQSCHSSRHLGTVLTAAQAHDASPLARMVQSALSGAKRSAPEETLGRLKSCQAQEIDRLESYLIFLATTGSTAPFIGLLGTVWGIMDAFHRIGTAGSASLAVVSPAIAEALVTTAAGLAAAIPAVMAYNFFVNWVRKLATMTETFVETFQSLLTSGGE